jgi:hypothetical protein
MEKASSFEDTSSRSPLFPATQGWKIYRSTRVSENIHGTVIRGLYYIFDIETRCAERHELAQSGVAIADNIYHGG